MKTIVALVDFSDVTFKILKQAHHLAAAFDSQVIILHVVPPEPVVVDFGMAPTMPPTPSSETLKAEQARLAQLQESLMKFGVRTSALQIQAKEVDDLMADCRRMHADLIIIGSHGHGTFYSLLIGTITADVLKQAPCPVLVVPGDTPQGTDASQDLRQAPLASASAFQPAA